MKRCVPAVVFAAAMLGSAGAQCAETFCNRECLAGVMNSYLQAVVKHDASQLAVARNVKYTENGVRLAMGDGLWQTAAALPTYRLDVIDEEAGQVGLLGRISENGNNNWFAVRLKVEPGNKVSEIEVLVNRSISGPPQGSAGGAPPRQNTEPHPLMAQVLPANQLLTREQLADISNTYFTGLDTEESARNVPFSPDCQRRENGTVTANNPDAPKGTMASWDCRTQFDTGFSVIVTDIRERRFEVVDRSRGLAFAWAYFDHNGTVAKFTNTPDHKVADVTPTFRQPISFYIAEVFKVVDGNIRQIEAVLTTVPYQMESGW
ncbi:MAG TPA: hypothetical protein VKO83_01880 [Steroidobacteraceae bacterium]|nr:hypothetical protein [Steroidobacteraceae bacterium]